jgi:hypothetical protein
MVKTIYLEKESKMDKKQWYGIYKNSSCDATFVDGKWFVSQYFSEGYREKSGDDWEEGDFAIDTEDEDYATAVEKGYNAFLETIGEGTIIEYNRNKKELPANVIKEED